VYVYFRYDNKNTFMIILNNDTENSKTINTSRYSEIIKSNTKALNIITGESLNDISEIKIPANNPLILKLKK
nr:cyclomaltodextrinase C-terminal domain-containing protein [Bacteroidales bacterium]